MDKAEFESVNRDGVKYVIYKDRNAAPYNDYHHYPGAYIHSTCFQYETHGSEHLVSNTYFEDFIKSLGVHISENHNPKLFLILINLKPLEISEAEIRFLYTLKPKRGKTTYINLKKLKKTTSDKQFDIRWTKLRDDYQPTFRYIYPYFVQPFHGFFERILIAEKIREATEWNIWIDYEEEFGISITGDIQNSLSIFQCFLDAYRNIELLTRIGESLKHNVSKNKKENHL